MQNVEHPRAVSGDYLHVCRGLHAELTKIHYGRTQDLDSIQRQSARVRSSRRLTYSDVEKIRNSIVWNADQFGYWPSRDEVECLLESTEWDFWNLPKQEDRAIASLLLVFRQIEPVSVILRFIAPKHYGILSPPVEKVLGLGPFRRHRDRYQAYLENLRALREDRNFSTTADVDMALWVLQVGILDCELQDHLNQDEFLDLREGFGSDSKLREIRVGNLTRQLFSDITRSQLAEALLATNIELAGQIAGIEFERFVRQLVRKSPDDRPLRTLVDSLCRERSLDVHECVSMKMAVKIRNRAVHSDRAPREEEVSRLIDAMRTVERMQVEPSNTVVVGTPPTPEDFWRESTIDQLASAQGIAVPQSLDRILGAAAELWNNEEEFDSFLRGIHERRHEGEESREDNA